MCRHTGGQTFPKSGRNRDVVLIVPEQFLSGSKLPGNGRFLLAYRSRLFLVLLPKVVAKAGVGVHRY